MTQSLQQGQFWDRVTAHAQPITEALTLIRALIDPAQIADRTVLDAGCGAGDYSAAFRQLGAACLTGLDVSAGSLTLAAAQTPDAAFLQASLSALPYPDRTFDVVWSWGVLHYVPDTTTALHEIGRVLKPGGVALIHTIRANGWAALERQTASLFSSAPGWVEPLVLSTGERVVPLISRLLTGRRPEDRTSKSVRQKLHERLFVPGTTHMFTFEQLRSGFGAAFEVSEAHPPVSDLFKRNMDLTVLARKRR